MILITGGAGYIGSHVNKALNKAGYETVVLDNLIKGFEDFVKWGVFVEGDYGDEELLNKIFKEYDIEAVMHFGAYISVAESVECPKAYLENNYEKTLTLIKAMKDNGVKNLIFSSTAAVYGSPVEIPIKETHQLKPINPYGKSKLLVEEYLKSQDDINYVIFRYFNASGDDPDCEIGELHEPETHLIPLILDAALGRRDSISVFGDDYDTEDGSCVRDYIHVNDIANAHIEGLRYLENGGENNVFNIGNGRGFSVKEVISVVKKVTGKDFPVNIEGRRPGDPGTLVADSNKIHEVLGWTPEYDTLESIIETAWMWHQKLNEN
ncbi:MAG: UDP-glucose 4-epimerase GalE [Methanobrevibacter boviskoreani]|jgi:UDP-glucose 4-epimerase|uniref:UDP-glucose 4-epimerase GalE n=1 Tax=Methanobrevibacter boviskoreani TaxID=1348249 RepID=UPI0023A7F976|nr:UDP-glucose 4-epimerase GalE [Methanobrevibacter boviskoreani]MCI6774745.1 UDP-glucose 4-epimerase GalE [Methanobrevibacter boviskoreani]MCI6930576.1 UDP-glucose 4-epimerase GalE [Methanobrevibacter boviskoreani]MDD6256715.1 UDP-glucose 4-epimerase GalE [Methanobrevibacter boviskoreani]MDY5614711.1 UDP-glucose 4-epimerase GalE [Methanobrevibacter boviskoreani]